MQVEIWSDVMCPFCYIGKRRFEGALALFENAGNVEVIWKSYQLNPAMVTDPSSNINQYLADAKGWSLEHAQEANDYVTDMAKDVGLDYDMDKAVVANSFDAHRLIQLAKSKQKGDDAEELLFRAYFTEGKNIADHNVLINLGNLLGLDESEVKKMLDTDAFKENVQKEISEAQQIGVSGVPFFLINRQFAISGAQSEEVFLQALRKAAAQEKI